MAIVLMRKYVIVNEANNVRLICSLLVHQVIYIHYYSDEIITCYSYKGLNIYIYYDFTLVINAV